MATVVIRTLRLRLQGTAERVSESACDYPCSDALGRSILSTGSMQGSVQGVGCGAGCLRWHVKTDISVNAKTTAAKKSHSLLNAS
jgi:hypothetical protein